MHLFNLIEIFVFPVTHCNIQISCKVIYQSEDCRKNNTIKKRQFSAYKNHCQSQKAKQKYYKLHSFISGNEYTITSRTNYLHTTDFKKRKFKCFSAMWTYHPHFSHIPALYYNHKEAEHMVLPLYFCYCASSSTGSIGSVSASTYWL